MVLLTFITKFSVYLTWQIFLFFPTNHDKGNDGYVAALLIEHNHTISGGAEQHCNNTFIRFKPLVLISTIKLTRKIYLNAQLKILLMSGSHQINKKWGVNSKFCENNQQFLQIIFP